MIRKILSALFCFSMVTLLINCSSRPNLDSWLGNYSYEETPVKAIAGYSMIMTWDLNISKTGGKYNATLNVNGQQTNLSMTAGVYGNTDSIVLIFIKTPELSEPFLQREDTLFILRKNNDKITTRWMKLDPRLSDDPPKECNCFVFTGITKDTTNSQEQQ